MQRRTIYIHDDAVDREIIARSGEPVPGPSSNVSEVIARDLARYYEALQRARLRLRDVFAENEVGLVLDVCNGWMRDRPSDCLFLWHEVHDGIALNGLAAKWDVADPEALVNKCRPSGARADFGEHPGGRTFTELLALCDAAELFWRRVSAGENPEVKDALK